MVAEQLCIWTAAVAPGIHTHHETAAHGHHARVTPWT